MLQRAHNAEPASREYAGGGRLRSRGGHGRTEAGAACCNLRSLRHCRRPERVLRPASLRLQGAKVQASTEPHCHSHRGRVISLLLALHAYKIAILTC